MLTTDQIAQTGLPEKEMKVYLALLELGEASVQALARKSGVARATTYLVLDALLAKKLITQKKQGKRVVYIPEPPRRLLDQVLAEAERVDEQRNALEAILPDLQALLKSDDNGASVRYYPGIEGLHKMRGEMLMQSTPEDIWYSFAPTDYMLSVLNQDEALYLTRKAKRVKSKIIFSTRSEKMKTYLLEHSSEHLAERKFVSPDKFQGTSGFTVFGDFIVIVSYTGSIGGVVIQSRAMAHMMREWFLLTWNLL